MLRTRTRAFRRAAPRAISGIAALFLTACPPPGDDRPGIASLSCETSCDPDRPRSSSLILEWDNPTGVELLLEATTYKSGFERGLFKSANLSSPQPQIESTSTSPETDPGPIGSLTLARLTGVAYRLVIADVDPGSRYFFRLRVPSESSPFAQGDCVAQVCPIDFVDQQGESQ